MFQLIVYFERDLVYSICIILRTTPALFLGAAVCCAGKQPEPVKSNVAGYRLDDEQLIMGTSHICLCDWNPIFRTPFAATFCSLTLSIALILFTPDLLPVRALLFPFSGTLVVGLILGQTRI
jgi:hypothetical protein